MLVSWSASCVFGAISFKKISRHCIEVLGASSKHVYDVNFQWMLAVILISTLICCLIPTNIRDRRMPRKANEFLRFRLPNGRLYESMFRFPSLRSSIHARSRLIENCIYLFENCRNRIRSKSVTSRLLTNLNQYNTLAHVDTIHQEEPIVP